MPFKSARLNLSVLVNRWTPQMIQMTPHFFLQFSRVSLQVTQTFDEILNFGASQEAIFNACLRRLSLGSISPGPGWEPHNHQLPSRPHLGTAATLDRIHPWTCLDMRGPETVSRFGR